MTATSIATGRPMMGGAGHRWRERYFAGITRKGVALIVLLCVLNGVRRTIQRIPQIGPIDWMIETAQLTGTSLMFALLVTLAVVATYNRAPASPWRRYAALAVSILVSSAVGVALMLAIERTTGYSTAQIIQYWSRYALLGGLLAAVYVYYRVAEERAARAHEAKLDRERLNQQLDEARLQVLQAQIEPHFLFNTLATVRRLYRTAPAAAVAMLDNLMRYLAVALPQMRASDSTLGREVELAEAYLGIQQIRMGRRLAFEIEIPEALRAARLPPMMLLTLVENAIKHGLSPLPEGGFMRISASAEQGRLRLQVSDSGQGFVRTSGGGTGLANIRARLAAAFGSRGRLDIVPNQPRGITATLVVPLATPGTATANP